MKNLLLILLATLFVACNEGTRYDEPDMPVVETTVDVLPSSEFWKRVCEYKNYKFTKFTILKNQSFELAVSGGNCHLPHKENCITLPLSAISNKDIFVIGVEIFYSASYSADQNKYIEDNAGTEAMVDNGILYLRPYCSGTFDIVIIWKEADKNSSWEMESTYFI